MAKAYSYLRFSTPEQQQGDSFRRQFEATRRYAQEHGLDLDESLVLQDLGLSGYHGEHIQHGALGVFLNAVQAGQIPRGSYLLVESLDRLSRARVHEAFAQFNAIISAGITIVTLTDGRKYSEETISSNFADLLISLTTMYRAHEESDTKAIRLKAAWKNKRILAKETGKPLTAKCPAWLSYDKEQAYFEVNPERAEIVERIYQWTLDGHGKTVIARRLNHMRIPNFGRGSGWHESYIQKILTNPAVYGAYQPMHKVRTNGKQQRIPSR